MERVGSKNIYLSNRILGQFYRHCSLIERIVALSQFGHGECLESATKLEIDTSSKVNNNNNQFSSIFILPGWKRFYHEAEEAFLEYKLRITSIMDQLNIDSEIVFFSDVYEDKSDVSRMLVMNLLNYFREKFETQVVGKSEEDRRLCASSWYAICIEENRSHNRKMLLGLPWIISDEMCKLAMITNLDNNDLENITATATTSKKKVKTIHNNDRLLSGENICWWTKSENCYIDCDDDDNDQNRQTSILFSITKPMDHNNTSVRLHFWRPLIMLKYALKFTNIYDNDDDDDNDNSNNGDINNNKLYENFHKHLENMQIKFVLELVMKWINRIRRDIYLEPDDDEDDNPQMLIQLVKNKDKESFTEDQILRSFILVRKRIFVC